MPICNQCQSRETRGTHKVCFKCNHAPHGELRKYVAGCRCDLCRQASTQRDRDRKAGLIATKSQHGTHTRYRNGCRYEPCVLASRQHRSLLPHGMSIDTYNELLTVQNGECPLCGVKPEDVSEAFHIDHGHNCDHPGGKISCSKCWRGLLCQVCNPHLERKLGHAYLRELEGLPPTEEDIRILEYLRNPPINLLSSRHQNRTGDNEPSRDNQN